MYLLAIESSCDDTSISYLDISTNGIVVLSQKTASQIDIHKKYGGVVPEVAARRHADVIIPVVEEVIGDLPIPDAIAVTAGPGLITGLLVGVEVAKTLSLLWHIPVIPVNHIEGHIHSVLLEKINTLSTKQIAFPALCLIVSGGHTELLLMKDHGDYDLIGKTRDDAAGEAFDKVAKLLNLDYPGGPKISEFAKTGNTKAIPFPRPMLDSCDYSFSFSGLKTAALYWLKENKEKMDSGEISLNDFCASFEQAIIDVLTKKTLRAISEFQPKSVILGGGVSNNAKLRETLDQEIKEKFPEIALLIPQKEYTMDNAAMIGVAGYFALEKGKAIPWQDIVADPNWTVYR